MTQGVSKKDGRTGRGYAINSLIIKRDERLIVEWTCPKCNTRNDNMLWLGRRFYTCQNKKCNAQTDIKGQTIGMNKTTMGITPI